MSDFEKSPESLENRKKARKYLFFFGGENQWIKQAFPYGNPLFLNSSCVLLLCIRIFVNGILGEIP